MSKFQFNKTDKTQKVPAGAMKFNAKLVIDEEARKKFKKPAGSPDASQEIDTVPVKIDALSGVPIEHPYWGKIVHDFSGMSNGPENIPLDFAHHADEDANHAIGFCLMAQAECDETGLHIPAQIVPYPARADDAATEILHKMSAGVPYQASINWGGNGIKLQYVDEGEVTEVNGKAFEGQGIVVRNWPLRGMAVCSYGADQHTATTFNEQAESFSVESVEGKVSKKKAEGETVVSTPAGDTTTLTLGDTTMAEVAKTTETAVAATQTVVASVVQAAVIEKAVDAAALSKEFTDAFGDKGAIYFCKGMTFAAAQAEHNKTVDAANTAAIAAKDAENAALKAQLAEANTKLSAAPRGNSAASFTSADKTNGGTGKTGVAGALDRTYSDGTKFGETGAGMRFFSEGLKVQLQNMEPKPATTA